MARVLKRPGSPVAAVQSVKAITQLPEPKPAPQGQAGLSKRRLKSTEHPAVAQFKTVEAKARVREALAVNPNLQPSAFSHRPGREGCPLSGSEAERVMSGKSIRVVGFEVGSDSVCLDCFEDLGSPSKVEGKGFTIVLFESKATRRSCMRCSSEFKGER